MSGIKSVPAVARAASRMTTMKMSKSSSIFGSHLQQVHATNFEHEERPHLAARLTFPGLTHESFDRNWHPKMTSIMNTSSLARIYALHTPLPVSGEPSQPENEGKCFMDWPQLTKDHYLFMSSSEFVMSRAVYDNSVPKWPLDMKFSLGNVGNCSVASVSEFFVSDGSVGSRTSIRTPLWTNTNQLVSVDKVTRKPTKLPDWFKEKYNGRGCMDKGLILRPFDRPAITYVHPFTVQWTDTDNYKHTNWTTYVRWATDALHAALLVRSESTPYMPHTPRGSPAPTADGQGPGLLGAPLASAALRNITKDAVAQGLHKMHVTYLRECLEGEHVDIHVWQEEGGDPELVLFSIVKGGEDVCQLKFWYFPEDEEFPI